MSDALSIAEAGIGAVREAEGKAGAAFRLLVEKNDTQAARIAELEAELDEALNQLDSLRHSVDVLEGKTKGVTDDSINLCERIAGEKDAAWNAALEAAELKLRVYAPHLVDGPENDVGFYYGYHSALDRIRAMKEENND